MYAFLFALYAHQRSSTACAFTADTGKLSTTLTVYMP